MANLHHHFRARLTREEHEEIRAAQPRTAYVDGQWDTRRRAYVVRLSGAVHGVVLDGADPERPIAAFRQALAKVAVTQPVELVTLFTGPVR